MPGHWILSLSLALGAAAPLAPAPAPVMGTWALEVERLDVPAPFRPRSVTIGFAPAGSGSASMTVDIVDSDGSQRHMASDFALDGSPAAIRGDTGEADTVAVTQPRPDVLVVNLSRAGVPGSVRTYTVTGDAMVETAASWSSEGAPKMRTVSFRRQQR